MKPYVALFPRGVAWTRTTLDTKSIHNWEPSVVTWNYENIRSLTVVIWSQDFPLSYLVQPLQRLKYNKDLVQMHLTF